MRLRPARAERAVAKVDQTPELLAFSEAAQQQALLPGWEFQKNGLRYQGYRENGLGGIRMIASVRSRPGRFTLAARASCHAHHGHHAARLVLEHMAMQHPVARVVGDERDLGPAVRIEQHGVGPRPVGFGPAVAREYAKDVAMQVDRVPARRSQESQRA